MATGGLQAISQLDIIDMAMWHVSAACGICVSTGSLGIFLLWQSAKVVWYVAFASLNWHCGMAPTTAGGSSPVLLR